MGRIRTVKPEMALHEGLFDLEQETGLPVRFFWALLPTQCDREGRFEWRPRRLKAALAPYDDIDFSRVLDAWTTRGFVQKYTVNGVDFGCIPTWHKHQVPNNRERASDIPEPPETQQECGVDACPTREPREADACPTPLDPALAEGKGREQGTREGDKPPKAPPVDLPDWLDADAWKRFLAYRKKHHRAKPFTDLGKKRLISFLSNHQASHVELLEEAEANGWLKPVDPANRFGPIGQPPSTEIRRNRL